MSKSNYEAIADSNEMAITLNDNIELIIFYYLFKPHTLPIVELETPLVLANIV